MGTADADLPMNINIPTTLLLTAGVIAGCATEPLPPPPPPPRPQPAMLDTNVYFYPLQGRTVSADQQGRDKYECNTWAVQQTGFDPSEPHVAPHQRMRIIAGGPPPGAQVGAGAVTGAVVGAAVSRPWEAGRGALIGGIAGAAIGGIAEATRKEQTDRVQAQASVNANQAQAARLEQKSAEFRRALSACLEARGYSVK